MVVFRVFSQGRIQERTVEQTIPATSLAETIVVVPVIQMQGRTQQVVNTSVQHIVDTVKVQKPTIQEKINQVTKHIKIPQVSDIPVVTPRQILPMTQTVQKTTEIPQLQFPDQVVDVPLAFVVLVPQMQVVQETVEISQLDVVETSAETSEIQTIHGTQTSESLSTAPVRQVAQSEVVEAIEIGVKTIDLECVKVHPAGLVKPDDPDTQIKFLAAETLHGIHGNVLPKN